MFSPRKYADWIVWESGGWVGWVGWVGWDGWDEGWVGWVDEREEGWEGGVDEGEEGEREWEKPSAAAWAWAGEMGGGEM